MSGSKIINPFAKCKRKIRGAGGGRAPTGEDVVWLQHCSLFKSWALTPPSVALALPAALSRQAVPGGSCWSSLAAIGWLLVFSSSALLQRHLLSCPSHACKRRLLLLKRFSSVLIEWEAFAYDASVDEVLRPCKIFFEKGGCHTGRGGGFTGNPRKTQSSLCIPLTRSSLFGEAM